MTASTLPSGTAAPLPTPPVNPEVQAALDANHLKLLEIGFYISGVMTAFRFLWLLFLVAIFTFAGIGTTTYAAKHPMANGTGQPPPAFVFFIAAGVFGFIIVLTLIFAGLEVYAGRCLKQRRHPLLIHIVAALYCISIPWGTALGVFTFMVLSRPSVKALFDRV